MTRALRLPAAVLAGVVALGVVGVVGTVGATGSQADGACADADGVTVIVDFASAGGGVQTRCAGAQVTNGFDALTKAGFEIRNVSSQPGFLCQIDAKPGDETCSHTPPASRYWSYWYAPRGGSWTYSSSGGSRKPPPGSVEGWAFGASDAPRAAPPPPVSASTTTTQRSAPTTTTATSVPPARDGVDSPTTTATTTPVGVGGVSSPPASAPGGSVDEGGQATAELDDDPASVSVDRDGSPAATLTGLAVVLALVGVAARTARRRNRDGDRDTSA